MRAAAIVLLFLAPGCLNLREDPPPACDEADADPVTCRGLAHFDAGGGAPPDSARDLATIEISVVSPVAVDPGAVDSSAAAEVPPAVAGSPAEAGPADVAVDVAPPPPDIAPPPPDAAPAGPQCTACAPPKTCNVEGAAATCVCPQIGFLTCSAGECVSRAHAFEGGSLEGAHVNAAVTSDFSKALRGPVEIRPFQGGHWLAADVRFTPDIAAISFIVPICPAASSAALRGKTFSAKLWVAGPPLSNGSLLSAATSIPVGFLIASRQNVAQGVEIPVVGQFPDSDVSDKVVEVEIGVAVRNTTGLVPWDGTVYLDEIVVGD